MINIGARAIRDQQPVNFEFSYTRLLVENYAACREFYTSVLGLEVTFTSEIDDYSELTSDDIKLTLLSRDQFSGHFGSGTDFAFDHKSDSIALSFCVSNVDEAYQYLKTKGVETVSPPWNFADWGVKSALVRDPDGNLIELTQMGDMVGADSNG